MSNLCNQTQTLSNTAELAENQNIAPITVKNKDAKSRNGEIYKKYLLEQIYR